MEMYCSDCPSREFVLDYEAVKKIGSSGIALHIQIADPSSDRVICAKCFKSNIRDIFTGKLVNEDPELLRKVFRLAELPTGAPLDFVGPSREGGSFRTRRNVLFGHIYHSDFTGTATPRQDSIDILADHASGQVREAVVATIEDHLIDLYYACRDSGAGVSISLSLAVHTEQDAEYARRPETETPCYAVVLEETT